MRVVSASGAPEAYAFVTISDKATGARIASLQTGRDGYFSWPTKGELALAITSARGDAWAYLPSVALQPPRDLPLRRDCVELSGTVSGTAHPPFIDLGRASDQVGDSFAVAVAADGTFHACLPNGSYLSDLTSDWRGEPVFVRAPAANLVLPVEPRGLFERATGVLDGLTGETADEFVSSVPEAVRVIALGESNHAAGRDSGGITSDVNRRALAAHELLLRLHNLEATDSWEKLAGRDEGMAELALDVLSRAPSSGAVLWAHIAHLGRTYTLGEPTMGEYLSRKLTVGYQVFVMLAAGGSARAWDLEHKIGVIARELPAPPPYSLEAMLAPHAIGPVTYFQFASAKGAARGWLAGLHPFRNFGAVHPSPELEQRPADLRVLDGALLFEAVHPTEPTRTGERRAK